MAIIRFPGTGVAAAQPTEAAGGFWCIQARDFTEPYPAHVHARLTVAVIDAGELVVQTPGGVYVAAAGSVLVLNSFRVHAESWSRGAFRAAFLSSANLRAVALRTRGEPEEPGFSNPVVTSPSLARRFSLLFHAVVSRAPVTRIEGALSTLVSDLHRVARKAEGSAVQQSRPVMAVRDRLHAGIAESPTIADLARTAGQSEFHFIRSFHREVGLPPGAYHNQLRVAQAKEMIAGGSPLSDVVYSLGFCDQSHLTRAFKRSSLVPPGAWSRMLRKPRR